MKRLFLLRHAKAGFGQDDKSRPLAKQGKKDAFRLGQYLAEKNLLPDHILCSAALRAKETFETLSEGAELSFSVTFLNELYLASEDYMTQLLHKLDPSVQAPMIIAHNPGLAIMLHNLAYTPPHDAPIIKFPPCMVSILDFDIKNWSELRHHSGYILQNILPATLNQTEN